MSLDPGTTPSQAVVQITLGQVFSEVREVRQEIRDLAASVRIAVSQLGDHETRLRTVEHDYVSTAELEKLELRIGALERRVWSAAGVSGVVAAGVSAAATVLSMKR